MHTEFKDNRRTIGTAHEASAVNNIQAGKQGVGKKQRQHRAVACTLQEGRWLAEGD